MVAARSDRELRNRQARPRLSPPEAARGMPCRLSPTLQLPTRGFGVVGVETKGRDLIFSELTYQDPDWKRLQRTQAGKSAASDLEYAAALDNALLDAILGELE